MSTTFERIGSRVIVTIGGNKVSLSATNNVKPAPRDPDYIVISEKASPQKDFDGLRLDIKTVEGIEFSTRNELVEKLNADYFNASGNSVSLTDENGNPNSLIHPLYVTSRNNLVYEDIAPSTIDVTGWTGNLSDCFGDLSALKGLENTSSSNPKSVSFKFKRSVATFFLSLGSETASISNLKIVGLFSGVAEKTLVDMTGDNTKYPSIIIPLPDTDGFNGLRFEFHTADAVKLTNIVLLIAQVTFSEIRAQDDDDVIKKIRATGGFLNVFAKEKKYEKSVRKFGSNANIGTGTVPETICDLSDFYVFTDESTPVDYYISSSSASDINKPINVEIITTDGTDWFRELITVVVNGQNKLKIFTENPITSIRFNRGWNATDLKQDLAGDIYIYEDTTIVAGVPSDATKIRGIIQQGEQQTLQAVYSVPSVLEDGSRVSSFDVTYVYLNVLRAKTTGTKEVDAGLYVREFNNVFRIKKDLGLNNLGTGFINFKYGDKAPLPVLAKSDIKIDVTACSANNTKVTGGFGGELVAL